MAKIVGIESMTPGELNSELANGARFLIYPYCISLVVVTFKRSSDIYFVRAGDKNFGKVLTYCLISLLLGWWGIPWGPIYTISSLGTNLRGGKNVTAEVVAALNRSAAPPRTNG